MLKEEWRTIKYKDLENYKISTYGKVSAKDREGADGRHLQRQMMNTYNKDGSVIYLLASDGETHGYQVARLVAYTFIGKPKKNQVIKRVDGKPWNNKLNNISWDTRLSALVNDKKAKGEPIRRVQARKNGHIYTFDSMLECCRELGLKAPNVSNCLNPNLPNRRRHHGYTFNYVYEYPDGTEKVVITKY